MINTQESCFFTGHRTVLPTEINRVKSDLKNYIIYLIEKKGVKNFIAGGALGFDTVAAKTVLELKSEYDIQLVLFLPCKNQTYRWRPSDIEVYNGILSRCDFYYYISEEYTKECMLKRNRAMADAADYCICYKRRNYGGTAYTFNYAKRNGKTIIEL